MANLKTISCCTSDKRITDLGENSSELNIAAKLRRLKAEEIIMSKSLMKSENNDLREENAISTFTIHLKTESCIDDLKKSFAEIKNLFQDVKCRSLGETLKETDIDDVKKDVNELDSKIIALNQYLLTELNSLKMAELEIIKQIDETTSENKFIKRRSSLIFKPNKDFILSPVKSLITTPARCLEVQNFQDFMKNSSNRYGGWLEYNHGIFLKLWEKYVKEPLTEDDEVENQSFFPSFLNEVLQKCHGVTKKEVISHAKWYLQFNILKNAQQKAIEKWKSNKRKNKSMPPTKVENKKEEKLSLSELVDNFETKCCDLRIQGDNTEKNFDHYHNHDIGGLNKLSMNNVQRKKCDKLNYLKPTKQWVDRSVMYNEESHIQPNNLDELQKLYVIKKYSYLEIRNKARLKSHKCNFHRADT